MFSVGVAMKCSQRYERAFLGQESLTMSKKCFKHARLCCKKNAVEIYGYLCFAIWVCECMPTRVCVCAVPLPVRLS